MSEMQAPAETTRVATPHSRQIIETGRYALEVSFGVQRMMLEELAKAGDEMLECMRAEIEIASEFIARLASAHSVKEITTACNDCGHHQAEAFRQDSQMLLQQTQRLYEQTSRLLAPAPNTVN